MNAESKKLTSMCGFLGSTMIMVGSLITAIAYHGRRGESYSVLNHFVSELGEVGVSSLALLSNAGLIAGCAILLIFTVGLALHFQTGLGYLATTLGIVSCISCGLVGAFPMNNLSVHTPVAYSFFYSGLAALISFNLVIIFDKKKRISKWLIIPALVTTASFVCFVLLPYAPRPTNARALAHHRFTRPDIWPVAVLEWCVFLVSWHGLS